MKTESKAPVYHCCEKDRRSIKEAIRLAQKLVRQYIPPGRMLSEELMQDRRKEAADD